MDNSNLTLWDSVSETDPAYTKKVSQKGGFTAICHHYQAKLATERFGTYGSGWGLESSEFDLSIFDITGMIIHKAVFFYVVDGERSTFPLSNAIKPMSKNYSDEDFAKKLETNTLSKALSRLGFSADVFMGLFDDPEYVSLAQARVRLENADDFEEEQSEMLIKFNSWLKSQCEAILLVPNSSAVKSVIDRNESKLRDKLKIIKVSPKKVEQAVQRLYKAGNQANKLISERQAKSENNND